MLSLLAAAMVRTRKHKDADMTKPEKTIVIEIPEAVGVFDNSKDLQDAVYDLHQAGFSRYDLSLLGDEKALKEKLAREKAENERLAKIDFDKKVEALRLKSLLALKEKLAKIKEERLERERKAEVARIVAAKALAEKLERERLA